MEVESHHLPFHRLFQTFRSRPKLFACALVGIVSFMLIPDQWVLLLSAKSILAWNCGSVCYLLVTAEMMFSGDAQGMQKRAVRQNVGRWLVLGLVIIAALVCVGAIFTVLFNAKELQGVLKWGHIALVALTVFTSWVFTQVMFAQHYAHEYYFAVSKGLDGGLDFPKTPQPDYADFLYFACIIGTSAQTADVNLTSQAMRRVCLLHCMLAFFFNTTLIALTINIGSTLI
jgi:uncharacterized membrane protein